MNQNLKLIADVMPQLLWLINGKMLLSSPDRSDPSEANWRSTSSGEAGDITDSGRDVELYQNRQLLNKKSTSKILML